MDDFRTQLTAVIDHMMGEGDTPIFLVVDLYGALEIKRIRGAREPRRVQGAGD